MQQYLSDPVEVFPDIIITGNGMVIAFRDALKKCVEAHDVDGPENCEWLILFPKMPGQCDDILGNKGSVAWKLKK